MGKNSHELYSEKPQIKMETTLIKCPNVNDQDTKAWKITRTTRDVSNTVPSHLEPRATVLTAGEQLTPSPRHGLEAISWGLTRCL